MLLDGSTNPTHRYSRTSRCNRNHPCRRTNWSRRHCRCCSPIRQGPGLSIPTRLVNQVLSPFSFSLLLGLLAGGLTIPARPNSRTGRCNRNRPCRPMNWSRLRCCCYSPYLQSPKILTKLVNQVLSPFLSPSFTDVICRARCSRRHADHQMDRDCSSVHEGRKGEDKRGENESLITRAAAPLTVPLLSRAGRESSTLTAPLK